MFCRQLRAADWCYPAVQKGVSKKKTERQASVVAAKTAEIAPCYKSSGHFSSNNRQVKSVCQSGNNPPGEDGETSFNPRTAGFCASNPF